MVESSVSPGAMGHHGGVAGLVRHLDGVERLGQRADLVDLDQDRVGEPAPDALGQPLGVGDEDIVADQLDLARSASVSVFQPAQSSSAMPSSMETIG